MLLAQFIRDGADALGALYPPQEARSLVLRLCSERLGVQTYTHIIEPEREIPAGQLDTLNGDLARLVGGEPLQYVLGFEEFCGRRFKVGPGVLIPRPETEELVRLALEKFPEGGSALDLCTGSGCIAWSLALGRPGARVTAVDISCEALEIAARQFAPGVSGEGSSSETMAARGHVNGRGPRSGRDERSEVSEELPSPLTPTFVKWDVLEVPEAFEGAPFDVITANPPYIRRSERERMHINVLQHEPELALFVPDTDPLIFYCSIAQWTCRFLKPGGFGIVEINEDFGAATAGVFASTGLRDVSVAHDVRGKERFVHFTK